MNTVYTDLEAVLRFRDKRAAAQEELIRRYAVPIISFTMNIAGPVKRSPLIDFAFDEGVRLLCNRLGRPMCIRIFRESAGCGAIMGYNRSAAELKEICVSIENKNNIGRLYDLDIIDTSGEKLSRSEGRRCLICGGPVAVCARSRAHSVSELQEITNSILADFAANTLADRAVAALVEEVSLTPKPGLVDKNDSGAHQDMDLTLMVKSANSLRHYFFQAASLGIHGPDNLPEKLQQAGIDAEKEMLSATGGVNTHRGAIYSLGLLCAGKALCIADRGEQACKNASLIAKQLHIPTLPTHGEIVRRSYPVTGPREEAFGEFPNVCLALRLLLSGSTETDVLLKLISEIDDSNVLWRGGAAGLKYIKKEAAAILAAPDVERIDLISKLNEQCVKKNISPGGAADLLAAAIFLFSVEPITQTIFETASF